jgi:PAS domain S-box-containing protein
MSTSRDSTNLPLAEVAHLRTLVAQLQQERAAGLGQAAPALETEISRKQRAEAALRASEQQYQLLYNDNPSMYFTLSQEGTVLSVNRFGADQLGYRPDALIGQSVLKVFRPEDHQTVLGQLMVCASSPSKLFQWDIQKIRQDGARLWVRERARAIHDHDGRILILVVCEDITAQREAEEQMRRTTQALQTLIQMSPLTVMALDHTGETVTLWNQAAESMFGWTSAEVLGRPVPFLFLDQREESDRLFDEFLRQGHLSGIELRRKKRDGSPIDLALWATVVKDDRGRVTGTLGFLADITQRKRDYSLLQATINSTADGLLVVDRQGKVSSANQQFLQLWRIPDDLAHSRDDDALLAVRPSRAGELRRPRIQRRAGVRALFTPADPRSGNRRSGVELSRHHGAHPRRIIAARERGCDSILARSRLHAGPHVRAADTDGTGTRLSSI